MLLPLSVKLGKLSKDSEMANKNYGKISLMRLERLREASIRGTFSIVVLLREFDS